MNDSTKKEPLTISRPNRLELTKTVESGKVKQNFQHGRSKTVTVEVRKTRTFSSDEGSGMHEVKKPVAGFKESEKPVAEKVATGEDSNLTNQEMQSRLRALESAKSRPFDRFDKERKLGEIVIEEEGGKSSDRPAVVQSPIFERRAEEKRKLAAALATRQEEEKAQAAKEKEAEKAVAREPAKPRETLKRDASAISKFKAPHSMVYDKKPLREIVFDDEVPVVEKNTKTEVTSPAAKAPATTVAAKPLLHKPSFTTSNDDDGKESAAGAAKSPKIRLRRGDEERRNSGKITVSQALNMSEERVRSLASLKRQREKAKRDAAKLSSAPEKIIREVVIPEIITVQELANRMAERAVDVVKALMKMGSMVTVNQPIDADMAELIVGEFGHKVKRVAEGDVENILRNEDEQEALENRLPRAPVVTIMGHVDHGKTSLLDALRKTDVVAGEAGGITQHIGAYQVTLGNHEKITFLDTPGHEAFTSMRARGAKVTDIVVLVVAADDGIKEQTKEAISHAKAAGVPIIVAINKIDKPAADTGRVKNELMQNDLLPEEFGGEIMVVEVSAKTGVGLEKLEETILLQAEVLELKANPARMASGAVIEAKIDRGRGVVATLLIQNGTLKVGEIIVAGGAYGKIRAIIDDKGRNITEAPPSLPVEVLGLINVPDSGDEFNVVASEKIARDITEYRQNRGRNAQALLVSKSAMDNIFAASAGTKAKELTVIIKSDVHGSAEAISQSVQKFSGDEVVVRVIHSAVGAITESDVTLANATRAVIVGFNVRATSQARTLAERDKVIIRYYSVIYDVVEDIKAALSGMLSPVIKENFLGYAEIRDVFNLSKYGKVAGCMITEGIVKRGAKVRLLRDNVVIHNGTLKTLKRFKDDVKEVSRGMECGMAFENYEDIRTGDQIEAYETEEVARTI